MPRVETTSGTFIGDTGAVTLPVGVLQSGAVRITPALPAGNATALGRLRMNDFEKILLRFPARFWDDGVYAIRQQGQEGRWWHSWYDLTRVHGEPVLLTFAAGPAARATVGGATSASSTRSWPSCGACTATVCRSPPRCTEAPGATTRMRAAPTPI